MTHFRRENFMSDNKIPLFSADLIRSLDERYPHRCPTLTQTEREMYLYAGKRELIDNLLLTLKRTEKNVLVQVTENRSTNPTSSTPTHP